MSKRSQVFILFTAAFFVSQFFLSANAVIAADLSRELDLTPAELGLMSSVFYMAFALVQLPLGVGLDRWGPRWVTPGLMLLAAAGSMVFALAPSFPILALGRALIGMGMSGVLMGGYKAISQWYPPRRFATVSGLLAAIGVCGSLLAATPLAWLDRVIGWRAVFGGGSVVILCVSLAIMLWAENKPGEASAAGGSRAGSDLRAIFTNSQFWRIVPLMFLINGIIGGFRGLWAGPYLFDVLRLEQIAAGNLLLLLAIGAVAGPLTAGWIANRLGSYQIVIGSTMVFILCQLLLAGLPPMVITGLTYICFGYSGGFLILLLAQVRQIFPSAMTGQALSTINLFAFCGTFLIQWWIGLVVGTYPVDGTGHYPAQAYTIVLQIAAAGTFLSLLWYLPLLRNPSGTLTPVQEISFKGKEQ
ncbi:MAG: MFS transporter [Chloroflexi bacterium]|nr:MFS transporter [Chloroflexota bacterium]